MIENYGTQLFTHTLILYGGLNLILHSYFDPLLLNCRLFIKNYCNILRSWEYNINIKEYFGIIEIYTLKKIVIVKKNGLIRVYYTLRTF